jgi:4-hydroxy-3-polyprenylbenzoate decarboxylase
MALREFLRLLESKGQLHRTGVDIDPVLELTEVSTRALKEGKPALLVEKPRGSKFPLVVNHFSNAERIRHALGEDPDKLGGELVRFAEEIFPPSLKAVGEQWPTLRRAMKARPKTVGSALSQQNVIQPGLDLLPIQKCWPGDGGKFITYGQVHTCDPLNGKRNIGLYRMHVFDERTTGMHWQIQKGGGFHYYKSEMAGRDLEIAVALGTDPALLFATIAALPEGIDEAMFAGFLMNRRVEYTRGKTVGIDVPASAEFILEGVVPARARRIEGPFGDHFGHYSAAAEFPVFHLKAITHRNDPVYPAIVVGKPPMEDKFLGDATQQILGPLIKLIHKEVTGLWAYYEAGFHNLLVVAIEQRYQKEALKAALGIMGTDQLSLTKCIVTVSAGVDPRDWDAVLREIREHFDPHRDFVMIPKVPLDTLDFTSFTMNLGSKMVVDATRKPGRAPAERGAGGTAGADPNDDGARDRRTGQAHADAILSDARTFDSRILDAAFPQETILIIKVQAAGREIVEKLVKDTRFSGIPVIATVSDDVDIHDRESYIWGIFTRFDCERDVVFTENRLIGIAPVYRGAMGIDATWKQGYPKPLVMDDDVVRRVDEKWGRIWK